MDHLPRLKSHFQNRAYPAVPLLCSPFQYGGRSRGYKYFRAFPERLDIQLDCFEPQGIDAKNIHSKLPALQAWLFFGVLTEVFGEIKVSVDLNDFVKTQSGQPSSVITTACLEKYLYCWMAAWAHWRGTRTILTRYARNVDRCLEIHSKVVSSVGSLVAVNGEASFPWKSETHAVLLSLAVLGEALQEAYQVINHRVGPQTRDKMFLWQLPVLDRALIEAGWCQGEITTDLRKFNTTHLLYLTMIDRHGLDQDHSTCKANHRCRANQVDFAQYETKHVPTCPGTNCAFMGPPMREVGRILCDGDIPLIALEKNKMPYAIEVSRSLKDNSAGSYVAISHVWSEGLGNRYENNLPLCQLERLQSLVNSVYSSSGQSNILFWIDTICVPLVPKLKTLAIASMDRIYAGARGVLVLDNSLQRSWSDASDTERLVRLGHSVWKTRLWTYQEGRLAQDLWFQFQDRAVEMRSLFQSQERYLKLVEILNRETYESIVSHPNLAQLARALALEDEACLLAIEHDACLPKQANPDMEETRLLAIEIQERREHERKMCGPWRSRIVGEFPQGPTGDDMRLRTKIFNNFFDTVVRQAQKVRSDTLGMWSESPAKLHSLAEKPEQRMAVQLVDTCIGLQGRRTSRVEDESVCLSVLLGLDVKRVLQVPVLHWKVKDALIYIRSFNLGPLFDAVKGFIDKILRNSHERRMKVLYSQIGFLPYDVIIWNTPRLHGSGWRWAPASFLVRDSEMTGPASCHCRISKDGLIIPSNHQSLAVLTLAAPAQRLDALKDTACGGDIIQIRFPVPVMEFFLRWKDARLRVKRALPEGHQLWQELPKRDHLDDVVILVARDAPAGTPEGRLGVLCQKYREEANVTYLHYMALIERCESPEDGEVTSIEATFHSMKASLCID